MPIFCGIEGVKHKISGLHTGVDGVKHEMTEMWAAENGVKKKIYQASPYNPILENNSWEIIKQASEEGVASSVWSIGDSKTVKLNGRVGNLNLSGYYECYIIGFDHNESVEGKGIHFQFGRLSENDNDIAFIDSDYPSLSSSGFVMNTQPNNIGGWASSHMRTIICTKFLNLLPDELQTAISPCKKYTDNVGGGSSSSAITSTEDKIFLPSEFEIFGKISISNPNEAEKQSQYEYYKTPGRITRHSHLDGTTAVDCWLRSTRASDGFAMIERGGYSWWHYANRSKAFSPIFKI